MNKNHFFQLFRFGVVGVIAALVHFSVVVFLVESFNMLPLAANLFGYLLAFQVSYSGHRYWTFRGTVAEHRTAFPKLLLVQSLGFAVNESLFYIFMTVFHLPYMIALLIVLTVLPMITFFVNKFWVFV